MKYDEKISVNVRDKTQRYIQNLEYIKNSSGFNNVKVLCRQSSDSLAVYYKTINGALKNKLDKQTQQLVHLTDKIENNNPIANLKKGYSLVFKDGKAVESSEKLKKNDKITVRTHLQQLDCVVESAKTVRKKETV